MRASIRTIAGCRLNASNDCFGALNSDTAAAATLYSSTSRTSAQSCCSATSGVQPNASQMTEIVAAYGSGPQSVTSGASLFA